MGRHELDRSDIKQVADGSDRTAIADSYETRHRPPVMRTRDAPPSRG